LPGKGGQMVQPIHIDDLVELVVSLATEPMAESGRESRRLAAVGPEAISLRKFYGRLRRALGVSAPARYFNVPMWGMRVLAWLGRRVPRSPLDPHALSMLERGNAAQAADTEAVLGHAARGVGAFVRPGYRADVSLAARLRWLAPILRVSVALVWLAV